MRPILLGLALTGAAVQAFAGEVPSPAAVAGYTTMTFGPGVRVGDNWQLWGGGVSVAQQGDGTVLIRGGGNGYNAQIQTAQPDGNGGYRGTVFAGGGYFEATMSFTGDPVTDQGWPSFWANDIENQIGNGASQWKGKPAGFVNSIECDFVEFLAGHGKYGVAMHDWHGQQSNIQRLSTDNSGSPVSLPPGTDTSKPHRYGFLWVPATEKAKGQAKWYFDGQQVGNTITWNQYNPNDTRDLAVGSTAFSVMDSRNLYLILGTGPRNPMTVYGVEAWQGSGKASSASSSAVGGSAASSSAAAVAPARSGVVGTAAALALQKDSGGSLAAQSTSVPLIPSTGGEATTNISALPPGFRRAMNHGRDVMARRHLDNCE